jgi:hypothetical protein
VIRKLFTTRKTASARIQLRLFQSASNEKAANSFQKDLALLQSKDLDVSVRLGALLAFDALLATAAINPISASPGAPLSLDAPTQPWQVVVISLSVILLSIAALLCVRGMLFGEEFDVEGEGLSKDILKQRMLAAYCASIDAQLNMIRLASRFTIVGGLVMLLGCGWIMAEKIWG